MHGGNCLVKSSATSAKTDARYWRSTVISLKLATFIFEGSCGEIQTRDFVICNIEPARTDPWDIAWLARCKTVGHPWVMPRLSNYLKEGRDSERSEDDPSRSNVAAKRQNVEQVPWKFFIFNGSPTIHPNANLLNHAAKSHPSTAIAGPNRRFRRIWRSVAEVCQRIQEEVQEFRFLIFGGEQFPPGQDVYTNFKILSW